MGCCGGTVRRQESRIMIKGKPDLVGQNGMVVIEYVGPNIEDTIWEGEYGEYLLGSNKNQSYIDIRDKEMLLDIKDKGKKVFIVVDEIEEKSEDVDLSRMSLSKLKDELKNLSPINLRIVLQREKENKNRPGAIKAIEAELRRHG